MTTMHRITTLLAFLAILIAPAVAFAQDPDAGDLATVSGAFTLGAGAILGLVSAFAVAVYRRRKQLAKLDTAIVSCEVRP